MDLSVKLQSNNPVFDSSLSFLPTSLTHRDMLTKYEKIPTYIYAESSEAAVAVAAEIAALILEKQKKGEKCILGLPTGSTQIGIYSELVRLHKEEGLSFKNNNRTHYERENRFEKTVQKRENKTDERDLNPSSLEYEAGYIKIGEP